MRNFLTKTKSWLVASTFAVTAATAQQPKTKSCPPSEQGQEMSKSQLMPIYSAPARIDVNNSWDLYAAGKFIYWQAREENIEIGIISENNPSIPNTPFTTQNKNNMSVVVPHFTYRPGFKIGVGANLDYDNWDVYSEYTWFHGEINTGVSPLPITEKFLYPIQGPAGAMEAFFFQAASQSWDLKMDFLDVSLARSYYWGTRLTLRPYIGARGAWIRQHLETSLIGNPTEPNSSAIEKGSLHDSSISWAVGPRGGFESNWLLGYGLRLIGNGNADILYTRYSLHSNSFVTTPEVLAFDLLGAFIPTLSNAKVSQKIDYLRTHAELEMGFGWGTYFANHKWHIDLAATYGFQVFWNQNMFRNFESTVMQAKSFAPNGNLYVHGMTLSTMLDF